MKNLSTIWKSVLGEIEVEIGKSNFSLYIKNSSLLSINNSIAKIAFANQLMATQANQRYYSLIQNILQKHSEEEKLSLVFEVDATLTKSVSQKEEPEDQFGPLFASTTPTTNEVAQAIKRAGLRPDFSLEEFCVSTSNQLAFAAAQAVASTPGKNYNPFFIWGGVGLGKTHLMQAIGHEILRKNPHARIVYAPGEQFTNEIVGAIRNKNTQEFRQKYRTADALLIDDIQFIAGRETTQEEFFHTFNQIQSHDGQIVLTSDRKPSDIKDLADRLKSRFEGGLVADISTPDQELKIAICMSKAKKRGLELSNSIASAIANSVDNIRSLEGALQRVISEALIRKTEIDINLVNNALKIEVQNDPGKGKIDARQILDIVCEYYGLTIKTIKGEKRDRPIARPRQILMYLLKTQTAMTYIEMADFLGGRDHTTIMHGVRKIETEIKMNEQLKNDVTAITNRLY